MTGYCIIPLVFLYSAHILVHILITISSSMNLGVPFVSTFTPIIVFFMTFFMMNS